jgi:hypothetical protein
MAFIFSPSAASKLPDTKKICESDKIIAVYILFEFLRATEKIYKVA